MTVKVYDAWAYPRGNGGPWVTLDTVWNGGDKPYKLAINSWQVFRRLNVDRDVALRVDGYMIALGAIFSSAAQYVRNNVPENQRNEYIQTIGKAFGAVAELSNKLYAEHPDIVPKEMQP